MKNKSTVQYVFLNGITYKVSFGYTPEEAQTLEYPGCDEEYFIEEIKRLDTIEELRFEGYDLEDVERLDKYEQSKLFHDAVISYLKLHRAECKKDF